MKMVGCLLVATLLAQVAQAQLKSRKDDFAEITRQCSAIRELVYAAYDGQFRLILADQLNSSNGYQTQGTWQFETTRYSTDFAWQGANSSYIEHYAEGTDSTHLDQWQYIAEYSHVPDVLEAERLYRLINREIAGCPYPVNDSVITKFIPLPAYALPAERPAALEIASLYEIPFEETADNHRPQQVTLMVGMEKRAKDYRVSLIVESTTAKRPTGAQSYK